MHSSTVAVLLLALAAGQSAVAAPIQSTPVQARDAELDARTVHLFAPLIENLQNSVVGGLNPRDLQALDERGFFTSLVHLPEEAVAHIFGGHSDESSLPQPTAAQQGQASRRSLADLLSEGDLDDRSLVAGLNSRDLQALYERGLFGDIKKLGGKVIGHFFSGGSSDDNDGSSAPQPAAGQQGQATRRALAELLERELDERSFASALIPKLGKLLPHFIAPAAVAAGAGVAASIFGGSHSSPAPDAPAPTATAPVDAPTAVGGTAVPAERDVVEYLAQRDALEDYLANALSGRSVASDLIGKVEKFAATDIGQIATKIGGHIGSGIFSGIGSQQAAPPTVIVQAPAPAKSAAAPSATSAPAARDIVDHLIQRELNDRSLAGLFKHPIVEELGGSAVEGIVSKVFAGHGPKATPSVITVQAPPAAAAPAAANPAAAPPSRRQVLNGQGSVRSPRFLPAHFPVHDPTAVTTTATPSASALPFHPINHFPVHHPTIVSATATPSATLIDICSP
ncbi:hypothetical protein FA95DRAFT_1684790, partial [Auriscalpium vulgare]